VREREIFNKKIGRGRGIVGERERKSEKEGECENPKQKESG
jgi:hypothetical protein